MHVNLLAKKPTFLLILDIEKAYGCLWGAGLLWHPWQAGVQGEMCRVLAQMTDSPRTMVLHNGCMSSADQPEMG